MAENIVLPKQVEDLTGREFGRLTAQRYVGGSGDGYKATIWECLCDCGDTKEVRAGNLKSGHTKSCGCANIEALMARASSHKRENPEMHMIWMGMRGRCNTSSHSRWEDYGGRGIKVCDRWNNSFEAFLEDMGERPTPQHSIDRIDVNGDYSPENCRWATRAEQCRNRRSNQMLTYKGKTQCITDWAQDVGLRSGTLRCRIQVLGWSAEKALITPARPIRRK